MIEDTNETDDQIRVLDIIMTEDWKSGRAINGEFKEIHLMHYYEHYLENFSTLLFNGQTIHRIGPPKGEVCPRVNGLSASGNHNKYYATKKVPNQISTSSSN